MAEMNGRMNGSQFFPPPAFCLRFPALQACTEDLPLVLQKPDNFPLVMGILQEINHEKVGFSSQADSTYVVSQRPCDKQIPMLTLSKVKLENLEVEDQHQPSCNSNPDLYQEWSLKGVEELLTDSEEFQLRHDCYQQAHEAAETLDLSSAQEEKPLFSLHSTHSQVNQRSSDEALFHVDEKLALYSRLPSSLEGQVPLQGRVSPIKELSEAYPGLMALEAAVLANNKTHHQQAQACVEDSLSLDNLPVVKREPHGHACHSEAEMRNLSAECISTSSEVVHAKENTDHMIPRLSKDKSVSCTDTEVNKIRKTTLLGHTSPAREDLISGLPEEGETSLNLKDKMTMDIDHEFSNHMKTLPESDLQLNLETGVTKRWTVHNILRTTSAILALPAEFTEQEKIQVSQESPSTSAAEGTMCCIVSSEGGVDSQQVSIELKVDRKHHAAPSETDHDFCEFTLSLGSSQPETALCPKNLDCHSLHEGKPVAKSLLVQEERHGQCQRTTPNQWQQATRCGSHKVNSMPVYNEKPSFPPTDGRKLVKCDTDGEGSTRVMRSTPKTFSLFDSSSDEMPKKTCLFKEGPPSSLAGHPATVSNASLDGGGSRRALQLMPQSSEDEDSALERGEAEELPSEDDQAEPNQTIGKESSNVQPSQISSQSERASEFKEPDKKRMRGTLPIEEKGDGAQMEKDTRCHRSDGKSWRCVRECINGAYYCQYHLRARRIGYNRRKNRDIDTGPLDESVSKKSLKSRKKSRQLLSTSSCNSKP